MIRFRSDAAAGDWPVSKPKNSKVNRLNRSILWSSVLASASPVRTKSASNLASLETRIVRLAARDQFSGHLTAISILIEHHKGHFRTCSDRFGRSCSPFDSPTEWNCLMITKIPKVDESSVERFC